MSNSQSYASYLASSEPSIQHAQHIHQFYELATMVAREQIEEYLNTKIEPMINNAVSNAVNSVFSGAMQGIGLDVKRIVDITIKGLSKQYHSEEVDKFMADALADYVKKELSNIDLTLIVK